MNLLDDAGKARLYESLRRPDIWDRCHKYGWVITLVGTILLQLFIWVYSAGTLKQTVDDFGRRLDRLERQVDKILEKP